MSQSIVTKDDSRRAKEVADNCSAVVAGFMLTYSGLRASPPDMWEGLLLSAYDDAADMPDYHRRFLGTLALLITAKPVGSLPSDNSAVGKRVGIPKDLIVVRDMARDNDERQGDNEEDSTSQGCFFKLCAI